MDSISAEFIYKKVVPMSMTFIIMETEQVNM